MNFFNYYLFDADARLIESDRAEHSDILDAFERMRDLLDRHTTIEMVQLWQAENFVGHIKRSEGRLVLKNQADPLPAHPLFTQDSPEIKAS
jgi:hypothetical protein